MHLGRPPRRARARAKVTCPRVSVRLNKLATCATLRHVSGRPVLLLTTMLVGACCAGGCGAKYNEARQVDGQTYYVERRAPNLGERAAFAVTHACSGGVRDDRRAQLLVVEADGCPRSKHVIDYVTDGIHRVEACSARWRIKCIQTPSTRSASPLEPPMGPREPLGCGVECFVEDHYDVAP